MKTLNLKLQGGNSLKPIIQIDGKQIDYTRNKNQSITLTHKCESDSVNISITNAIELNGPCWWLMQMVFFVISIFGILNPKLVKVYYFVDYQASIRLDNDVNDVVLRFNTFSVKGRAVEPLNNDNNVVEEVKNEYGIDTKAKKRRKVMVFSYVMTWIIVILAIIIGVSTRK